MDNSNLFIFIVCAFALGVVLILSRNNVPPRLRRGFALTAVIMVAVAFILMIYSLYTMGT
ncbi:hypothetical protein J25TS5_12260 [Paenibacillus faecis]|uniref:Signal transduction histidine kinase n=1 Tax=Paenibacillus faecis TaxID=862114 RepID=A0A5D0CXX4_9BACL|nr:MULTISPECIES: hypothetical protein [Paenibacillus]MCA1291608.1 hypothetical protein [Paenibacillus sp. alder61]TYA14851.1 hypothetical protein FRY98_04060 [Paenibacillus faecis]GIO84294.1 hypothetical protein J25TS5_12260 [Paenibacillus faecis]